MSSRIVRVSVVGRVNIKNPLQFEEGFCAEMRDYFFSHQFDVSPAATAPRRGATQKSQSCCIATPPTSAAGPSERAGLTDVPVIGMNTIWISTSVRPIASPANAPCASAEVAPSTTRTNIYVATSSATNAHCALILPVQPFCPSSIPLSPVFIARYMRSHAPAIAPIHCASIYHPPSVHFIRPATHIPTVTAGLM
jgi:hypothetical protein